MLMSRPYETVDLETMHDLLKSIKLNDCYSSLQMRIDREGDHFKFQSTYYHTRECQPSFVEANFDIVSLLPVESANR